MSIITDTSLVLLCSLCGRSDRRRDPGVHREDPFATAAAVATAMTATTATAMTATTATARQSMISSFIAVFCHN